jgi:hypothetical protein
VLGESKSLVEIANEEVSIFDACRMTGMDLPDFEFGSQKLYCPFGHLYHADEGMSKAFRVYPSSNSAYCFACVKYFSPVSITALDKDLSLEDAAELLLERNGYVPPDTDSRWAASADVETVNADYLAEALKVACERMDPLWEIHQFDEPTAIKLRQCLGLLSKVQTDEQARKWLASTKTIMSRALGAHHEAV